MKQTTDIAGATEVVPIQLLPIEAIVPDPNNRKDHNEAALAELASSIAADGLLQPIVVRPIAADQFQIVAGERRWLAFQSLGRSEIPARVMGELAADDAQLAATRRRLAENFHRVDLSPIEKARDLEQLFKDGMTNADVVEFVGAKDPSTISNMMRLLKLPKKVQDWLQAGSLTAAHGKALLRFENWPKLVEAIAERAIDQGASSKALEKGLPFVDDLVEDGHVFDFEWKVRNLNTLPAKWRLDPDFVEAENQYEERAVYCLDVKKGRLVCEEVEAAIAAEREKSSSSRKSGESVGLSATELAARKRKMEQNKAARAAITATSAAALARLKKGGTPTEIVHVVIEAALADFRHSKHLAEAAKLLDLKLPKERAKGGAWRDLSMSDGIRIAALAVMIRERDDALRFAGDVPQSITLVAGGVVKSAPIAPPAAAVKLPAKVKAAPAAVKRPAKKRAKRAVITDATRAQVKRAVESGRTGSEIAKQLGISLPSVQNIKKALGLVRRAK